jgi:Domain of unknown function (DUF4386)
MTIGPIDELQRKAARVAGFTCQFMMATVVFATYGIYAHLIVVGNAAESAQNIMAHERQFRIVIACYLIYGAGVVVLLTALYVSFWLLFKGLRPSGMAEPDKANDRAQAGAA